MEDKTYELMEKMYIEMQKGFQQVDARFEQIDERFEQVDARFEQIDERFEQVDGRIDNLEKTVLRIEQEHGEKLQALFDFQKTQEQVNERVLSSLERIEEKLEIHDTQISALQCRNR